MSKTDDLPDVSLRLLEIFAAMMGAPTTVAAAETLSISQPAVSAGLRQLETQLGITLFERTGRRLEPTAEAKNLYEEIRPLFGIMRSFSMRARDLRMGRVGRLRIMATPPPGYSVAPLALRRFLETRPEATVTYDVRRLENVIDAVQTGQADLGIALSDDRQPSVSTELLGRAHMMVLLPGDDPLAARPHLSPADLGDRPFIGIDQASYLGRLVARGFEASGVAYDPRVEVRYCQTAASLVASGLGVAVVDPWSAQPFLSQGLVLRAFLPASEIRCVMLTRRGVPHSGLLHTFMAELRVAIDDGETG